MSLTQWCVAFLKRRGSKRWSPGCCRRRPRDRLAVEGWGHHGWERRGTRCQQRRPRRWWRRWQSWAGSRTKAGRSLRWRSPWETCATPGSPQLSCTCSVARVWKQLGFALSVRGSLQGSQTFGQTDSTWKVSQVRSHMSLEFNDKGHFTYYISNGSRGV